MCWVGVSGNDAVVAADAHAHGRVMLRVVAMGIARTSQP